MQILIDEYITGGGFWNDSSNWPPPQSLLQEALAMVNSLATDFQQLDRVEVILTRDERLNDLPDSQCCQTHWIYSVQQREQLLREIYQKVDWTVVIAPEIDNILYLQVNEVVQSGGKLLSPGLEMTQLSSDKQRCADFLHTKEISVPHGIRVEPNKNLNSHREQGNVLYPAVCKPIYSAGSMGVKRIECAEDFFETETPMRVEKFHDGLAVSVAVLAGNDMHIILEPCLQKLSTDGNFIYQGGSLPLDRTLANRARSLAEKVALSFADALGYYGIDMILGKNADGSEDVVLEVNPRLTTSYVGLRRHYEQNLAEVMLNLAEGNLNSMTPYSLTRKNNTIVFQADGTLREKSIQNVIGD